MIMEITWTYAAVLHHPPLSFCGQHQVQSAHFHLTGRLVLLHHPCTCTHKHKYNIIIWWNNETLAQHKYRKASFNWNWRGDYVQVQYVQFYFQPLKKSRLYVCPYAPPVCCRACTRSSRLTPCSRASCRSWRRRSDISLTDRVFTWQERMNLPISKCQAVLCWYGLQMT